MRCGLPWNDSVDETPVRKSDNPVQYVLDKPMASKPGTQWNYNTCSSHLLSAILKKTTGKNTSAYVQEKLFTPLNIQSFTWYHDRRGGWGLSLKASDFAKFGQLFLQNGKWNGKKLVSKSWVQRSTKSYTTTPWIGDYGYHWWVQPGIAVYNTTGAFGQNMYIIPKKNAVVLFYSNMPLQAADHVLLGLVKDYILCPV